MSNNSIKFPIEIVDKWGKPLNKFNKDIDKLNRVKTKDPFRNIPKSLGQMRKDLARYRRLQSEAFRTSHIKRYGRMIDETERKIHKLEKSTGTCKKRSSGLFSSLKNNFGIGSGAVVGIGVTMGIRKIGTALWDASQAAAKFEKYQVTLKTMLGSQGAARERMTEYTKIAASTPFQLSQVVEAGNKLQAIGQYSKGNLTMLGDLSAASGKPIEQVMNAFAKLNTGQKGEAVNMFRDLLVSSEDWAKATGKGIKKNGELAATTEEMIGALPKILKKKGFLGMMDEQAKTTEGRISNLGDSFEMLKVSVGRKMQPAFKSFLSGTTDIVESMQKWVAVPTAQKIANEKAELNSLVGIITDANTGEERRSGLIKQLQQQYPEFLKGLDAETVKNEQLRSKLVQVNKQYENKMRLAAMSDIVSDEEKKLQKLQAEKVRAQTVKDAGKEANRLYNEVYSKLGGDKEYEKKKYTGLSKRAFIQSRYGSDDYRQREATEGNKKSKELLSLMQNWRAYSTIFNENEDLFGNRDISDIDKEIKQLEAVMGIYKKNMNAEEQKQLLAKARGFDIEDKSTYEQLFGKKKYKKTKTLASEFSTLRKKTYDAFDADEWEKLSAFVEGRMKVISNGGGGGDYTPDGNMNLDLDKASATITGGAHNVKQYHITIGNLIGENTNMFKEGENPDDADDFMTKLTNSLQMIVNDTNYAAN
ncbi:MAG: hypothetical protein U9N85_00135 [Bacteroidota bacterium]|nr:hypothetical protein [Bacteroidota bacterium]